MCKKPFGILRTRAVEFLAQVFTTFAKDIADTFADAGVYDLLLFYFEHYPFHNILHAKVTEIFTVALDKNYEKTIDHLLYKTSLIKDILEISKEQSQYVFQGTGNKMSNGYMCFVRKLANKLVEMQKKNNEVNNCLESIPEWGEYFENDLKPMNLLESKPLASDPRKKGGNNSDDDLDFFFKLKSFNPTKGKSGNS